jgi:hypothetical protein
MAAPAPISASLIPSRAEPAAPDASLADEGEAYSHKGLTYPLGRRAPAAGELIEIANGVGWARLPVPGSLKHVNLWLLDDGNGVAVVDTGLDIPPCREAWEALLQGPLAGRPLTRIIVTHFHPDHLGLAGWLAERFQLRLWMTRTEWLFARMLTTDVRDTPPPEAFRLLARGRLGRAKDRAGGGQGLGPVCLHGEPGARQLPADRGGAGNPRRKARLARADRKRPQPRTCLPGRRRGTGDDRR